MLYVGLDVHCKQITICTLDNDGKVLGRWTVRRLDQMMAVLKGLPEKFQACYEASTGYGVYYELLSSVADRGERPTASSDKGKSSPARDSTNNTYWL